MPENQNIEWKESWRDEYLGWICGFANANGGKVFIGIKDDGTITGINNYNRLMEDIPSKIQSHLGIICDVNLHEKEGKYYIEIDVPPQTVGISYKGEYHYRTGSTKQVLRGHVLTDFLLKKSGKSWDDVIEPGTSMKDINEESIEAFKAGAVRSHRLSSVTGDKPEIILENLRLLKDNFLKRAAILLFGTNPRKYFVSAFIKIGKFGNSDTELLFQDIIEGDAFRLADKTIDILEKKYLIAQISYDRLQRIEKPEYPFEAIREILLNAIIHRTYYYSPIQISVYNNRIIFWNEGKLPEGFSLDTLKTKHPSVPGNPWIAEACFKGGLIEAWGRGTLKIIEECAKFNMPEPIFELVGGGISVTLYKDVYNKEFLQTLDLNKRQIDALIFFRDKFEIKTNDYMIRYNITDRTALRDLTELVDKELLIKTGDRKSSKYLFK